MPEERQGVDGRSHFGPVVGVGLGASALAAVASTKPWVGTGVSGGSDASMSALADGSKYPLASAVSLVLLAVWGVLLVTRGAVRRAFAVLTVVAALALVACVVAGHSTLRTTASGSLAASLGRTTHLGWTGWFWTTAVAAVLALVAGVLAVRLVGRWPEMGSRYDAPTAPVEHHDELDSERDLWHALDEGRDPTAVGDEDTTRDP